MKIEGHAVYPPPSDEDVRVYAAVEGVEEATAEERLLKERALAIDAEKADPLRMGWESPVWHVADALLGWKLDASWDAWAQQRFGMSWDEAAAKVRLALGFTRPVKRMLIMGANRSGKSEFQAKRGVQLLLSDMKKKVLWGHEMSTRSNEEQQPLVHNYLPREVKENHKATEVAYVKFKKKTGFSEGSFILANQSMGVFRNYTQEMEKALEGMELDGALCDERIPVGWVDSLKYRTATRDGVFVAGFTPVNGYTPTVKAFCDSMTVTCWGMGYCLPEDGLPADVARALGLTEKQVAEIDAEKAAKAPAPHPLSVPEDLFADILAGRLAGEDMPAGRSFERVPRVARGFEPDTVIIWFHGRDNPFGNPMTVMRDAIGSRKGKDEVKMRVYGLATKVGGSIFVKFKPQTHVIKDADIPKAGTNYMMMDPHGDRNNFMLWIRACSSGKNFTVREWPGNYEIPGHGIPEPWAVPSGRKNGLNDGDRGGGQTGLGFGYERIKFEVARLERWEAWKKWQFDNPGLIVPMAEEIAEWDEGLGAEEVVERRLIDARAGEVAAVRNGQAMTLIDEFAEIGLIFETAPGTGLAGGLDKLTTAFDWNEKLLPSTMNSPRHFCAASCINSIFAMENYQNLEGDKGPMKDPVDCHRWFYTAGLGFVEASGPRRRGNAGTGRWEQVKTGGDAGRGGMGRGAHVVGGVRMRVRGRFSR